MKKAPGPFRKFVEAYPESESPTRRSLASREAAGFAEKEAELLKLALSLGSRLEGAATRMPGARSKRARRRARSGASRSWV